MVVIQSHDMLSSGVSGGGGIRVFEHPPQGPFINYSLPYSTYSHLAQARLGHRVHRASAVAKNVVATRVQER